MLPQANFEILKQFSEMTFQVRTFFHERQFLEASTPTLVTCPGTEPYLDVFTTQFQFGRQTKKFYLPTSPEISLKKLICMGSGPIFEIKNVFRNQEVGQHHEPEFLMLEWYRQNCELSFLMQDVIELIRKLTGNEQLQFQIKSMRNLFQEYLGFELTPGTTAKELFLLAQKHQLNLSENDSIDDLFGMIFVDLIESKLPKDIPTFVTDYPPFQAAYAKINAAGWADRFELYWRGLEIANAFHELTDAELQRQRMQQDNEKKKTVGKEPVEIDEEFLALMKHGMPNCSGIALGIERLFMAIYQIEDIRILKPLSAARN